MKRLLAIIFTLASSNALGQFNHAAYDPATFRSIIDQHAPDFIGGETDKNAVNLSAVIFKYRVTAPFSSEVRPLSETKKSAIGWWVKMLKLPESMGDLHLNEIKLTEGENEHWVVMQEPLYPQMKKELKLGQEVDYYIVFIGTVNNKFIFLGADFQHDWRPSNKALQSDQPLLAPLAAVGR